MLRFLKKHWRNWPTIIGRPKEGQYLSDPRGDHLSYDDGKCRIGFDFNAVDGERTYGWCMCAWMAIKAGRKNRAGVPYFVYDGYEKIPVIVGPPKTAEDKDHHDRYTEIGVIHLSKHDLCYTNWKDRAIPLVGKGAARRILKAMEDQRKEEREIIRKEIGRLDALWAKEKS